MTGDDALGRLLVQVGAGIDSIVEGAPAAAHALLACAAAALAERAQIITVVSPVGELGLSALIAQVSGRADLDQQDDAVLELGFKRLSAPGRPTVLMLETPQGMTLPALRYLQHVRRSAPGLVLVVLGSPALDAALEQPGAAAIRAMLKASPVIAAVDEPAPLRMPPAAIPVVAGPSPAPLSSPARRRAWLLPWAGTMVSVAAASVIVVQLSRVSALDAPASVSPPVSAVVTRTGTVVAPAPAAAEIPASPPPVVPLIVQPGVPLGVPVPVPAPSAAPPPVKPDRVLHARRVDPKPRRLARVDRPGDDWRMEDPTQYSWDAGPTRQRRPRWDEGPPPGSYAMEPYGTPMYPLNR